jgi:hypothetical protein
MFMRFRRGMAIPVWTICAVALGVATLSAPFVIRSLVVLLGVAVIGSGALVLGRRLRRSRRPHIEVLPARDVKAEDAADLSRMDGDAG